MLAVARSGILLPGQLRPCAPKQFVVPNGLVGYWGFDADCIDTANALALDLSGYGNAATLTGSPPLSAGKIGTSLFLNGTNHFVTVPSSTAYDGALGTYAGWFNTTQSTAGFNYLFGRTTGTSRSGSNIFINQTTGKVRVQSETASAVVLDLTGGSAINDGNWHHVVYCFNATPGFSALYVDGVQVASGTPSSAWSFASEIFRVGQAADAFWTVYVGFADDIRIYNRALDPWEVIQLYQAGLAGRRDAGNKISPINNAMVI